VYPHRLCWGLHVFIIANTDHLAELREAPFLQRLVMRIFSAVLTLWFCLSISTTASADPMGPGGFEGIDSSSGLRLWLESASLTQGNGTAINVWSDTSGKGVNAVNSAAVTPFSAAAPTRQGITNGGNSFGVARFLGNVDEILTAPDIIGGADALSESAENANFGNLSVFAVYQTTVGNANNRPVGFGTSSADSRGGQNSDNYHLAGDPSIRKDNGAVTGYTSSQPNSLFIRSSSMTTNGGGSVSDFFNGSQVLNSSANYNVRSDHFHLGDVRYPTGDDVDVAEVIVYNRALNAAERIAVENHLSSKFAISLNQNDFYNGDTGANGDYDFGVIGVGRVDASNQLATANNDGLGLAISGTWDDGDFVFAGHLASPPVTTDLLLDQVWYVDVTDANDNATVELSFDFSDAGETLPGDFDPATVALLYDSTQALSFSVISQDGVVNGDTVTFTLSPDLLNDGYFALGTAEVPEPGSALVWVVAATLTLIVRRKRRSGE
jgi:hypothetical protein